MDQRLTFVARVLEGEKIADLCREFGISRKTAYKFLKRYQKIGPLGLEDLSRKPHTCIWKTSDTLEKLILLLRKKHPTWGPKKLKAKLEVLHPGLVFPAASTMGNILERHGLITNKGRRLKQIYHTTELSNSYAPNDIWCVDFKGQFLLKDRSYCYPLTLTDHFSRYLLLCEALNGVQAHGVFSAFEQIFDNFGIPDVIRSDNGVPFSSAGILGLSQLSVWWIKLGIRPERIKVGCPQQNGRHERMHRTLKLEATKPPMKNLFQQQEKFDDYLSYFNNERPHEALGQKFPASVYKKSNKTYLKTTTDLEYPDHQYIRKVNSAGLIRSIGPHAPLIFIGRALKGENLGLRVLRENLLLVSFVNYDLGFIDLNTQKFISEDPLNL